MAVNSNSNSVSNLIPNLQLDQLQPGKRSRLETSGHPDCLCRVPLEKQLSLLYETVAAISDTPRDLNHYYQPCQDKICQIMSAIYQRVDNHLDHQVRDRVEINSERVQRVQLVLDQISQLQSRERERESEKETVRSSPDPVLPGEVLDSDQLCSPRETPLNLLEVAEQSSSRSSGSVPRSGSGSGSGSGSAGSNGSSTQYILHCLNCQQNQVPSTAKSPLVVSIGSRFGGQFADKIGRVQFTGPQINPPIWIPTCYQLLCPMMIPGQLTGGVSTIGYHYFN